MQDVVCEIVAKSSKSTYKKNQRNAIRLDAYECLGLVITFNKIGAIKSL